MRDRASSQRPEQGTESDGSNGPGAVGPAVPETEWSALRQALVAYVQRRGNSRDVAEDVAQESLSKLLRYTERSRPASLYALAFKIAASTLVDRARGEARYSPPVDEGHACSVPLPDTVAEDREQLALLKIALDQMPPLRRAVLVRRRLENQSCARISAELGLSVAAVEKHVVRGLGDLRAAMADRRDRDKVLS